MRIVLDEGTYMPMDRDLKAIAPTLWVPWEERYEYWVDEEAERFRREAMKGGKTKHKR